MLKGAKEEDFYNIKVVAQNRLRPDKITGFFWLTLIFSGLITALTSLALDAGIAITNPIWLTIQKISIAFLVLNAVVALFFTPEKNAYRYQRLQAIFLSIFGLKFSVDFFPFYFLAAEDRVAPSYMSIYGWVIFLGGLVLTLYTTLRAFKRVKRGEFRKDGNGLYKFKESKTEISIPIVFGSVMIVGAIIQLLSDSEIIFVNMIEVLFVLLLCTALQYAIALAWPEFLLLTISKFQFESFCIPKIKRKKPIRHKLHKKSAKVKK
ncbi:hypothetical protein RGU12_20880 [Fredinandcohnia sp. QZ13]|uniref:hypothetical protein n=1 Tax=Fredinandcohnia sp. QZ13 TaxID=3073144 RepID=UPI00285348A1|nr:hypothetical protein [Fredinandcohnia sp. QZ13]MDR4889954.1 hypothetical protein [Fredinandcohnia sp. QZ13]